MKTIRHSFGKQPGRLPASKGGRTGGRVNRRRGSREKTSAKGCEQTLRSRVQRPLGTLAHRHTRTRWIIDETVG